MELADRVANNLRHLRGLRGLTQAQAAAAAALPRATWAHLESGAANPTLAVITRAAQALQVSIEELLAAPRAGVELIHADQLPTRTKNGAVIRQLLPDPLPGMSLERIELPPRASFAGVPHTPGTKEYLACESGSLLLAVAGRKIALEPGDVVAFLGDQKHSYANPGARPAVGYSAVLLA
jgi:transcriptional regulator with XRE-family HTH domain